MKFGIREICDVVLKAKATQKIGSKTFYKNEPVIYFDTLKTSTLEGAATTVYAQGGKGNARLVAWEGERTLTFTMEDALISPAGFMILSGAGLIEADANTGVTIKVHTTETTDNTIVGEDSATLDIYLKEKPYWNKEEDSIYVMLLKDGEWNSEPYIASCEDNNAYHYDATEKEWAAGAAQSEEDTYYKVTVKEILPGTKDTPGRAERYTVETPFAGMQDGDPVFVDYYVEKTAGVQQIEITADKFGGNYYLEASTLFRTANGTDLPAEFIIPNCKIQSNFTFSMASSGDPSTFTFTMDAFPDNTRFDKTKKVLAAIQVISTDGASGEEIRRSTIATAI